MPHYISIQLICQQIGNRSDSFWRYVAVLLMFIITVLKFFTLQNRNTKRMGYFNDKKPDS